MLPRIDEIEAEPFKVLRIPCRERQAVRGRGPRDLQVCQLRRYLMYAEAGRARRGEEPGRRFGSGRVERIHSIPKTADHPSDCRLERVPLASTAKEGDAGREFEQGYRRDGGIREVQVKPVNDTRFRRRLQCLGQHIGVE